MCVSLRNKMVAKHTHPLLIVIMYIYNMLMCFYNVVFRHSNTFVHISGRLEEVYTCTYLYNRLQRLFSNCA